jgi:hypothetical protein
MNQQTTIDFGEHSFTPAPPTTSNVYRPSPPELGFMTFDQNVVGELERKFSISYFLNRALLQTLKRLQFRASWSRTTVHLPMNTGLDIISWAAIVDRHSFSTVVVLAGYWKRTTTTTTCFKSHCC